MLIFRAEFITFSAAVCYMLNPVNFGFSPNDSPFFEDNGTYLGIGVHKAVHHVEGPNVGSRHEGVVIALKKTPFHAVETVLNKASRFVTVVENLYSNNLSNVEHDKLVRMLKGRLQILLK